MTNTTSRLDTLDPGQPGRLAAPEENPTQEIVEAVRSCLQTSLTGEAQNFRSWVAAAHRKARDFQRLTLATSAISCLVSLLILLASIWGAHRVTQQAEAQLQYLPQPATASPDAFAQLRRESWVPTGNLIMQKGRTFIELKAAK